MCGIAGSLTSEFQEAERRRILSRMGERLKHRGPDGLNFFYDGPLSFAHRRLSIVDPETGAQPQTTPCGRRTVIHNGEIYNYPELREELARKGVRFRTHSDTEVLLRLFDLEGPACLPRQNGMFAFAVWDAHARTLFLARDRFGIKPLYYLETPAGFFFASEIKAFLEVPGFDPELDRAAYGDYLHFQFSLGPETFFKNVLKLLPGYFIEVSPGASPRIRRWHEPPRGDKTFFEEKEAAEKLRELLTDSVRLNLRSDAPAGAHLSGGTDSSAVVMLASGLREEPLATFTGRYENSPDTDESFYARKAAEAARARYHEIEITPRDFVSHIEKVFYHMDEPAAGPGIFGQYMVSSLAARHVKTVLGGQGGDELFAGYARYLIGTLENYCAPEILAAARGGNENAMQCILKSLPALRSYAPLLRTFLSGGRERRLPRRYFDLCRKSGNSGPLFQDEEFETAALFERFESFLGNEEDGEPLAFMRSFDVRAVLPALLHAEDRMSMAFGLETRVPFLDPRLETFAAAAPAPFHMKGGRPKYLLLEALKDVLPAEISGRGDKMGFPVPLGEWMREEKNPVRTFVLDLIESRDFKERGLYRNVTAGGLLRDLPSMRGLWGLISVELWHRIFAGKREPAAAARG